MPSIPKISIIVATLNGREKLSVLLANIGTQTSREFELIVIDGGSTDGTLEVVRNSQVVSQLVNLPGSGLYRALNEGISRATGQWFYFMGCDDYLTDDAILQEIIPYLDETKYDFVVGSVIQVPSGKVFSPRPFTQWLYHSLHHQGTFYHRRVFEKYHYNEVLTLASDYELTLRIFLKGYRLKTMGLTVACFNETGMSGTNRELAWKECEEIRKQVFGRPLGALLNFAVMRLLWINRWRKKPFFKDRAVGFDKSKERNYA